MSECKHEFRSNAHICVNRCMDCLVLECDVLREENERLKMKLLEKDDALCGENARLEHENNELHEHNLEQFKELSYVRTQIIHAEVEIAHLRKWREAGRAVLKTFPGELRGCTAFDMLRECERGERE